MRTPCGFRVRAALALLTGAGLLASGGPVAAAPFYEGKTLTIVVGYDPGGGYDRMARLMARYLPKYLPGSPTVVVQNMPGQASILAANYLYTMAQPDGLTIGAVDRNLALAQLSGVQGIRFDVRKFAWIASVSSESTVLVVRSDLPVTSFADLQKLKEPLIVGSSGGGASSHTFPTLLKAYLGANLRVEPRYRSAADFMLALERKEVDAVATTSTTLKALIERGVARPLVRTRTPEPWLAHLPVDEALAPTPVARAVLALRSVPETMGRPYVAPPGTPADRLRLLEEAFAKVTADPEAIAEAAKGKITFEFIPGQGVAKIIQEVFSQPPEVLEEFSQHIKIRVEG
ncbi:MAG TPA: tripartite tricarboxylate transporter substrate-binding protein [Thermodesulfobacteriota bacterium]|nr:tripartite tricarboxylate transporter substrate-binding protein [Thermodesulfobacteriota bacterium]